MAPATPTLSPTALEFPPTTMGEGASNNGTNPASPDAAATAARIAQLQEAGQPARDTLEDIAATKQDTPTNDKVTPPTPPTEGNVAAPHIPAEAMQPEASTDAALPLEKPEDTDKINHLLRDAANYLVGRQDERFVLVASAIAASPTTPVGGELRRNALITLRDLEPRTGLFGIIDKTPQALNDRSSKFVTSEDLPSSDALVAFLNKQRDTLPEADRDNLLPQHILQGVRNGKISSTDLIRHFSQEKIPKLKTIIDNLNYETTGNRDKHLPTNSREMLMAAGIDSLWKRMQLKKMFNPNQDSIKESILRVLPVGFTLFMLVSQMFQQDQKQAPQQ